MEICLGLPITSRGSAALGGGAESEWRRDSGKSSHHDEDVKNAGEEGGALSIPGISYKTRV